MNETIEDKIAYDDAIHIIDETHDNTKTVGIRSTWLLGLMVVIILALASFILRSYAIPEIKTNGTFLFLRNAAEALCGIHLGLLLAYIKPLIVPVFEKPIQAPRSMKELQEKIKQNSDRLEKLTSQFNTLVSLFVASVPVSVIYAFVV